jgi:hypothetical protein
MTDQMRTAITGRTIDWIRVRILGIVREMIGHVERDGGLKQRQEIETQEQQNDG